MSLTHFGLIIIRHYPIYNWNTGLSTFCSKEHIAQKKIMAHRNFRTENVNIPMILYET